jgi:hypothetical protein
MTQSGWKWLVGDWARVTRMAPSGAGGGTGCTSRVAGVAARLTPSVLVGHWDTVDHSGPTSEVCSPLV